MKNKTVNVLVGEMLEPLRRRARAAIKKLAEGRRLDRKNLAIEKGLAAGTFSHRQASDLKGLLRLKWKRLLNRELYRLLKLEAQKA